MHGLLVVSLSVDAAALPQIPIIEFRLLMAPLAAQFRPKDILACFVLHTNTFLEKSGNVFIEHVSDVSACLQHCSQATATYGFRCRIAMFNVNSKNCILSKFSRNQKKAKSAKHMQIDMYENRCDNESERIRLSPFFHQARTTTVPREEFARRHIARYSLLHAVKQYSLEPKPTTKKVVANDVEATTPRGASKKKSTTPSIRRPMVASSSPTNLNDKQFREYAKCFKKTPRRMLVQFEERSIDGTNLNGCLATCITSTSFYCASFNYNQNSMTCVLNGGNLNLNAASFNYSQNFDYYENFCQPRMIASRPADADVPLNVAQQCFQFHNNTLLSSFDAVVVNGAVPLEGCIRSCASRRPRCVAFNWVQPTGGCMIFHDTVDLKLLSNSSIGTFAFNACPAHNGNKQKTPAEDHEYYD